MGKVFGSSLTLGFPPALVYSITLKFGEAALDIRVAARLS